MNRKKAGMRGAISAHPRPIPCDDPRDRASLRNGAHRQTIFLRIQIFNIPSIMIKAETMGIEGDEPVMGRRPIATHIPDGI